MAENVIRKDVIQVSVETDSKGLESVVDMLDELKKKLTGGVNDGLDDLKKSVKGAGQEDGIEQLAKDAKKLSDSVEKAKKPLKEIVKTNFAKLKSGLGKVGSNLAAIAKKAGVSAYAGLKKFAQVGLEKLKSGLKKVKDYLSGIAKKAAGAAWTGLKKLAGISFKALAAGLTGAATAVGFIVKNSVQAYADYEQLVGGVETILGAKGAKSVEEYAKMTKKSVDEVKDEYGSLMKSEKLVLKNADNAYKTAGLSANEYMETVTGFSASLLQGLKGDTVKTAQYANTAVIDMADNANKMGTNIGSIQDAYQGFAKQNYTMLDNLKLGYGGTKEEMSRLVKDAANMTDVQKKLGVTVDSSSLSFDNIVNAIHVMQESMDINGTTAEEAEKTISGSLASMKSAWNNLLPALVMGGDSFDRCVDNLVDSVMTFKDNIMPAITKALSGVGELITRLAPTIEKYFPVLVNELLPPLIKATVALVKGLIAAMPTILKTIASELPWIVQQLGQAISSAFGASMPSIDISGLFNGSGTFKAIFTDIKNAVSTVVLALGGLIAKIVEFASKQSTLDAIKNTWNALKTVVQGVWTVISGVVGFLANNLSWIAPLVMTIVTAFVAFKTIMLVIKGVQLAYAAVQAIVNATMLACPVTWIVLAIAALIAIIVACAVHWDTLSAAAKKCWEGIKGAWTTVAEWFNNSVIQPVVSFFKGLWNGIVNIFKSLMTWVKNNFKSILLFIVNPFAGAFSYLYENFEGFRNFVNNILRSIKNFFVGLGRGIAKIASSIKDSVVNAFKDAWDKVTGIWDKLSDFFSGIWDGIKATGKGLKNILVDIWKNAVKAVAKPVNKVIGGANWILDKLGSDKKLAEWQPYARGTNGHKGGNALVNDGNGAELVQMPSGKTFIPCGRNVFLPNAPKGMKVLDAENTAKLMGRNSPTYNYKDGTGWDIFDFFDNAKGLVGKVIEKFVNYKGMSGFVLDVGKSMISKVKGTMASWVKKMFNKFGGKDIASYEPSKGVEQWKSTAKRALKMEKQYNAANLKRTLYQMQTESGGNPRAINLTDRNARNGTPSKGLMQVIDPTFRAYARKGYNKNVYDPLSNILASIRYSIATYGSLTKAYQGHGYANGGLVTKPGWIGEGGKKEMVIPLTKGKRERALDLWAQTGDMLGVSYSPEGDYGNRQSGTTEYNTYSPSFSITISGTNDDRAMARKVKKWVSEAMEETFDSMSRKTTRLQEV